MAKRAQPRVKQLHAIDCLIIQFVCYFNGFVELTLCNVLLVIQTK